MAHADIAKYIRPDLLLFRLEEMAQAMERSGDFRAGDVRAAIDYIRGKEDLKHLRMGTLE